MADREKVISELEAEVADALIAGKPKGYMFNFELIENSLALLKAQKPVGWISVKDRLPDSAFACLVTVWDDNIYGDCFLNILPYFVGWDGEQWNDYDGEECPFEVYAWMPIPEPPKEET